MGSKVGRRTGAGEKQPASGLAPSAPTVIQPAVPGGIFGGSTGAAGGATAPVAAATTPMAMDAGGVAWCRPPHMVTSNDRAPVFGVAPSTPPAAQPAVSGSASSGGAAGGSLPTAAPAKKSGRPGSQPQGAGDSGQQDVLYTSRPGGTLFGMAGVPGAQWAGGK